jgi:hypothetical protein
MNNDMANFWDGINAGPTFRILKFCMVDLQKIRTSVKAYVILYGDTNITTNYA